ncbi:MAG: cell division protein FtsA [Desulfovibrionaceae bacterium]|nr:cell division protein FtsA [Desulfovibrionaceae bacterium]
MGRTGLIAGLDIGTTKICAVVGEVDNDGVVEVKGIGQSASTGLRKGMVVNIEQTSQAIRAAIQEAELMTACEIHSVYVGIAGNHINSLNSHGLIAIKGNEIDSTDIERVLEAAKAVAIPADREVLHILPQEYKVDEQSGIINPLGMAGVRLEVAVHIVTGATSSAQNIYRACQRSNLEVDGMSLECLASAKAVLTDPERELGVALVDLGGGTTDIAVYVNNAIMHTAVLALGGQNVTNDIAFGLRTPVASAEDIKIHYGCAMADLVRGDEQIEVSSVGGSSPRRVDRQLLAEICEPRMAEILEQVDDILQKSGYKDKLGAGVVLTGGTALLDGCTELAEEIFGMPVRVGYPHKVGGLKDLVNNPKFATVVGLLYEADARLAHEGALSSKPVIDDTEPRGFGKIFKTMRSWFSDIK